MTDEELIQRILTIEPRPTRYGTMTIPDTYYNFHFDDDYITVTNILTDFNKPNLRYIPTLPNVKRRNTQYFKN